MTEFPSGLFTSPFRPAKGIGHPHLQTMFSRFHRKTPLVIDRIREHMPLPDGDELLLDHHTPVSSDPLAPLTVIVHGLSGSSSSQYVVGLQLTLSRAGWPSVAVNNRGAVEPNRLVRAYHAGAGDDITAVLTHLFTTQSRPLNLVGYSLGGSINLHALAAWGDRPGVNAAVVVSVPLDFPKCANRMGRGISRIYTRVLLKELIGQFHAKADFLKSRGQPDDAKRIEDGLATGPFRDFWEFDHRVVAPLHGFADVHDYYAKCAPIPLLKSIQIPTLVIHAADDPFMTPDVVPTADQLSPAIHFELSARGGHVGFIGGSIRRPEYYLERRIPEFLKAVWTTAQTHRPSGQRSS